jgi:hypothetical protein
VLRCGNYLASTRLNIYSAIILYIMWLLLLQWVCFCSNRLLCTANARRGQQDIRCYREFKTKGNEIFIQVIGGGVLFRLRCSQHNLERTRHSSTWTRKNSTSNRDTPHHDWEATKCTPIERKPEEDVNSQQTNTQEDRDQSYITTDTAVRTVDL